MTAASSSPVQPRISQRVKPPRLVHRPLGCFFGSWHRGFSLYREVDGELEAIHEGLLPGLLDAPQGGVDGFRDDGADASETARYFLVEVDVRGAKSELGPFEVSFASGDETLLERSALLARQAHELGRIGTSNFDGAVRVRQPSVLWCSSAKARSTTATS